jgi:hypothetical protein
VVTLRDRMRGSQTHDETDGVIRCCCTWLSISPVRRQKVWAAIGVSESEWNSGGGNRTLDQWGYEPHRVASNPHRKTHSDLSVESELRFDLEQQ